MYSPHITHGCPVVVLGFSHVIQKPVEKKLLCARLPLLLYPIINFVGLIICVMVFVDFTAQKF